jgi:phosphoenolpyruvate synthase/pyruvate phosphate dikinase
VRARVLQWYVFKPTLKDAKFRPIVRRQLGEKQMRMIYDSHTGKTVKNIRTPIEDRIRFCLTDDQVCRGVDRSRFLPGLAIPRTVFGAGPGARSLGHDY